MVKRQLHDDALSIPAYRALIVMSRIHKTLFCPECQRGGLVLLAPAAASYVWGLAAALADYLEAAVYRDYQLFNRRREVSFRKKLCRVTGHREVCF